MSIDLDSNISNIFSSGEDALQNIFDFRILSLPKSIKEKAEELKIDITKNVLRVNKIAIPEDALSVQEITVRGIKTARVLGGLNNSLDLPIDLIIDRSWSWYKLFKAWKDSYGTTSTKTFFSDKEVGEIIVTNGFPKKNPNYVEWKFKNIRLPKIGEISFDYATGEPVSISLGFKFCDYEVGK